MNEGFTPTQPFYDIKPGTAGPVDFEAASPQEQAVIAPDNALTDAEFTGGMNYEEVGSSESAVQSAPVVEGFNAPVAATEEQIAAAPEAETTDPVDDLQRELADAVSGTVEQTDQAPEAAAPQDQPEEERQSAEQPAETAEQPEPAAQTGEFITANDTLKREYGITSLKKSELDQKLAETTEAYDKVNEERVKMDESLKQVPLNPDAKELYDLVKQFVAGLELDDVAAFEPEAALAAAYGADSTELREWNDKKNDPSTTLGDLHNKYLNAVRIVLHRTVDVPIETKAMAKLLKDGGFLQQEFSLVA